MKNRNTAGYKWKLGTVLALLLAGALTGHTWAVIVSVSAPSTADTMIDSAVPSLNTGSWGAVVAGNSAPGSGTDIARDLIRFDLSAIPTYAHVTSATLRLALTGNNPATTATLNLYRVNTSWTEAGATWISRDGVNGWSAWGLASGVDYAATPSTSATSTFAGSNSARVDYSFTGLATDAQFWISNPASNYGWFLVNTDESVSANRGNGYLDKQWFTKEFVGSSLPPLSTSGDATPYLDITYEYAPEPGSAALLAVGGVCVLARRRLAAKS